ncbi:MAG TPA: hypothetical protein DD414_01535 [Lachnospiraceae bacterium]|nr:hypothetical protein [Lachnospiraceae bacterium]
MEGYIGRGIARKRRKKICAVLIISLLLGEICFLRGEAASPAQMEEGDSLTETELSDEGTEDFMSEVPESEITETEDHTAETSETDISEQDTPETKALGPEGTDMDLTEPPETENPDPEAFKKASQQTEASEEGEPEPKNITHLQIPEKLKVVLDPWEIDGKGQIYSEPFIVKNTGDVPGVLMLSFVCRINEDDDVSVRETREEFRDSEKKLICMRIVPENGEEAVFTNEGAQCQAKLEPGETLSLQFEGEMNESAEEPWEDGDVEIEGMYSWEEETIRSEEVGEESGLSENSPKEE